jgi:hypothetical protein
MNRDNGKRRLCVLCEHFEFSGGSPTYSEYTPGSSGDMACNKKVWTDDMDYMSTERYREIMLTAVNCGQFEIADDLKPKDKKDGE